MVNVRMLASAQFASAFRCTNSKLIALLCATGCRRRQRLARLSVPSSAWPKRWTCKPQAEGRNQRSAGFFTRARLHRSPLLLLWLAPHGYLIHEFLSPRRMKSVLTVIRRQSGETPDALDANTQARYGESGPGQTGWLWLSVDELMSGGLTHEEAVQVAAMCRRGGELHKTLQGPTRTRSAGFAPDGENDFTCWAPAKKATGVPIIVPNFVTPDAALKAITDGTPASARTHTWRSRTLC